MLHDECKIENCRQFQIVNTSYMLNRRYYKTTKINFPTIFHGFSIKFFFIRENFNFFLNIQFVKMYIIFVYHFYVRMY